MREIFRQIGRRMGGGEKERQPKFPLEHSQRTLVEEECTEALEKGNFGKRDFRKFSKNMVALASNEGDSVGYHGHLYLSVPREEKSVAIGVNELAIFDGLKPESSSTWKYKRNNRMVKFEGGLLSLADTRVKIPKEPYKFAYETVINPLPYLQAQNFCKEVFDLYLESSERKDFINDVRS